MAADYYTLLTTAGLAYETAAKAAGTPIKLTKMSVGDGNGAVYNPDATMAALKREVWRGDINALIQDATNSNWLIAELTIPDDVGGWYVREAGIWTDTGVLYAIVKYPESYKPVLASSGAGKEFYLRAIFQTSNAASVTLSIDETVVKATRAWVADYVAAELAKRDAKQSVRFATTAEITLSGAQTIDGGAAVAGDRVLAKDQSNAALNGIWVVANGPWARATDADASADVTPGMFVVVEEGTANASTVWQLVTDGPITLGTTGLVFVADYTAAQIDALLALKANVESPTFTGKPKAPKANQFTTGSQLINCDALKAAGLYVSTLRGVDLTAATVVLAAADAGSAIIVAGTGGGTLTLPKASTVPAGCAITVKAENTNPTTNVLSVTSGDIMVIAGNTEATSMTMFAYDSFVAVSDGVSKWRLVFDSSYAFVDQANTRKFASGQLLAANGYQKLPGGYIRQWGTGTAPASGANSTAANVVFPLAFPSSVFAVMVTAGGSANSSAGGTPAAAPLNQSKTGFTATLDALNYTTFNKSCAFFWEAIGV